MTAARDLDILDTVAQLLRTLANIHQELLALGEAKRQAIIGGDLAGLESLVGKEQALIAQAEQEDRRRELAMKMARKALGMAEGEGKLGDILERAGEPHRAAIEPLRARLVEIVEAVRYRSRLNTELIKASVAHADAFMKTLQNARRNDLTYSRKGGKTSGGQSMLDRSA